MTDKRKGQTTRFCKWYSLKDKSDIPGKKYPGVYVIAQSRRTITGRFKWRKEIVYVGMTRSKGGLASRLQQFQNSIRGGKGSGPAERFYCRLGNGKKLSKKRIEKLVEEFYVSASYTVCGVTKENSSNLERMGMVVKQEYDCLATYVRRFGKLPGINQN